MPIVSNRRLARRVARCVLLSALPCPSGLLLGQSVHPEPPPTLRAAARQGPVTLDGRLEDAAWQGADGATSFTQSQPNEGVAATQRTDVRILYDDAAIYVGARMYDSLGGAGVTSRLMRRDQVSEADTDLLTLVFDTFHDHLSRTTFTITPAGVKADALGLGGSFADPSWDPVWEAATTIDSLGWTAELRIPLSQLRFPTATNQTWGLQIVRFVHRLNERGHLAFWRANEAGGPSRYAHLEGLSFAQQPRRLELLPYAVAQSAHARPADTANPFARASTQSYRVGGDLKYVVTPTITLDATINPDFGQVEVDPAVVNLSAFETFFPEKRPFFVEGAGVFGYGGFSCYFCSNVSSMSLFYSRRIGRVPQGIAHGTYVDYPENTTILGAAKLTGRTQNGFSVGLLNAVTRAEDARVVPAGGAPGTREDVPVEPLTNYFVGRVKRELRNGALVLGGIATSTDRRLTTDALAARLAEHARAVGVDWSLAWGGRRFSFAGQLAATDVAGDPRAIQRLQTASARYFQRPDRGQRDAGRFSDGLDADATALRGYGGYGRVAKEAGDWLGEAAVNFRSPGFETNDLAFLTRADYVWMNANIVRQWTRPGRWYRNVWTTLGAQQQFNYDGDRTDVQYHGNLGVTLPNYWDVGTFVIRRPEVDDDRMLRGGPVVRRHGNHYVQLNAGTDRRKTIALSTNPSYSWTEAGTASYSANLDVTYKPAANVIVSLGPSFSRSASPAQYVTAAADSTAVAFGGRRYVFAALSQRTLSMNTRLNVTFTPTLSLELFAQPFVSGARFTNFAEFTAPRAVTRRAFVPDQQITSTGAGFDRIYRVDTDGAAGSRAEAFTFRNPDFTLRSLRGNAVLRWEYLPGSTLFAVWQQSRSGSSPDGDVDLGRDPRALMGDHPDNTFLLKVSYWLGR